MATIHYSPLSIDDLKSIHEYIASNLKSPLAAHNTASAITERIRGLESAPELGTPLSAICDFNSDYRFLVVNNYLVFYRFEADSVYIIRILYGRMNYLSILFDGTKEDDTIE